MSNEQDQTQFLNNALQKITLHSSHMKNSIDKTDLRTCLKSTNEMLNELKTNLLNPTHYYKLYTHIFDELRIFQSFIKDETNRGRRLTELYEAVQQSISIIPRLYLMISIGDIYIDSNQCDKDELIYDLILMLNGVQHPLRGLFVRYYFVKIFKDNLTIEHIITNLKEMNRLWIRINDVSYRNELKVLVGENITRLASMNDLSCDDYKNKVLTLLLNIITQCDDTFSMEYLIECIVHAFPDEYNVKCMKEILKVVMELKSEIDVNKIYIAIMDKISKYIYQCSSKDYDSYIKDIFITMNDTIGAIMKDAVSEDGNNCGWKGVDVMKVTELQIAFMNFLNKCALNNDDNKVKTINSIMANCYEMLVKAKGERKMSKIGINLVLKLLSTALESPVSVFELKSFPDLMNLLDYGSSFTLSIQLITKLVNDYNIGAIDNKDKMLAILELVKPILEHNESNTSDSGSSSNEQQLDVNETLRKLIFIPSSLNPNEQYDMLMLVMNTLFTNNDKYNLHLTPQTFGVIVNSFYILANGVAAAYEKQPNAKYDITSFNNVNDSPETLNTFYTSIYSTINTIFTKLETQNTSLSLSYLFKYKVTLLFHIQSLPITNNAIVNKTSIQTSTITSLLQLLLSSSSSSVLDSNALYNMLTLLIGALIQLKHIDITNDISTSIMNIIDKVQIGADKCILTLSLSKLQRTNAKAIEYLTKAKKLADYAMINPVNINLMTMILNEYVRCCIKRDKFKDEVDMSVINDLIEYVKNVLLNLKNETTNNNNSSNTNAHLINELERYYLDSIAYMKNNNINLN